MADAFKKNIVGYRGHGQTCPCCRETDKKHSRHLARARLNAQDQSLFQEEEMASSEVEGADLRERSPDNVGAEPVHPVGVT